MIFSVNNSNPLINHHPKRVDWGKTRTLRLTIDNGETGLVNVARPVVLEDPDCDHGQNEKKRVQQNVEGVVAMVLQQLFVDEYVRAR